MGPPLHPPSMSTSIRSPTASTISVSWSELPTAMVGDNDASTADLGGAFSIGRRHDAFEAEIQPALANRPEPFAFGPFL